MNKPLPLAICLIVMIAVIIGADVLLFRDHFWARLLANAGIVLICAALYIRFLQ
ncbi:MAG TPA: hypothetical protein VFL98_01065 [Candidatus Paceibacterota bacterium]|nr:hypothetical protein [Candidatus Paceibacterota bacterium]